MQQRYYDPMAGRFLSVDPVVSDANNGASFNRYNYAANNPYKYIDPDGRDFAIGVDPKAAKGFGHATLYFQDASSRWFAYNQGPAEGAGIIGRIGVNAKATVTITPVGSLPEDVIIVSQTTADDGKVANSAMQSANSYNSGNQSYNSVDDNCKDAVAGVVNGAGVPSKLPTTSVIPNSWIVDVIKALGKPPPPPPQPPPPPPPTTRGNR